MTHRRLVLCREKAGKGGTRILIVSDQRLLADAVEALLSRETDMEVVGNIGWKPDAANRAAQISPDLLIVDYRLEGRTAVDATRAIRRAGSDATVIFLTGHETDRVLLAAMEAGASAVVYENRPAAELVSAVRAVAQGSTEISAVTISRVLRVRRSSIGLRQSVTNREREILALLAKGTGSRDIAATLGVSYITVRTHLRNLAGKLAAHSKLEVLVKARHLDLIVEWPAPEFPLAQGVGNPPVSNGSDGIPADYELVISPIEQRDACA